MRAKQLNYGPKVICGSKVDTSGVDDIICMLPHNFSIGWNTATRGRCVKTADVETEDQQQLNVEERRKHKQTKAATRSQNLLSVRGRTCVTLPKTHRCLKMLVDGKCTCRGQV